MTSLRTTLLRQAYRIAYRVLRVYWALARPRKNGVKCVLVRDRDVLLVRHTYGDGEWDLPGGAIKRREEPLHAARREAREELGVDLDDWRALGELFVRIDGRRDRLWCFSAEPGDRPIEPDGVEIAMAEWFRRDDLPERRGKYVARIAGMTGLSDPRPAATGAPRPGSPRGPG